MFHDLDEEFEVSKSMHASLARLSTNGHHVIAPHSGKYKHHQTRKWKQTNISLLFFHLFHVSSIFVFSSIFYIYFIICSPLGSPPTT